MAQRALLPLLLYRSLACLAARVVTLRLVVLLQLVLLLGRCLPSPLLLLVVLQLVLMLRFRCCLLQMMLLLGPCLSLLQVGADSRLHGALQASESGSAPQASRSPQQRTSTSASSCRLDWAVERRQPGSAAFPQGS